MVFGIRSQLSVRELAVEEKGSGFRLQGSGSAPWGVAAFAALFCLIAGCGGSEDSEAPAQRRWGAANSSGEGRQSSAALKAPGEANGEERKRGTREAEDRRAEPVDAPELEQAGEKEPHYRSKPQPARTLADLLDVPSGASKSMPGVEVDESRAAAAGIRKRTGRRLMLYTDLQTDEEVEILPEVFDQAFPQWCAYFGIDPADHPDWQMTAFLMEDKEAFRQAGLYPDQLPAFENGFSWNYDLWLYEQPTPYYRRHLLLHEGTHGFMNTMLRGCGPPWYMEGIAELLATHRWHDGRLALNSMPAHRDEVPMWGRIRIVQEAFAADRAIHFESLVQYDPAIHPGDEPYGWCWAAAALLDRHPRYQDRFRQLPKYVAEPKADFASRFRQLFADDWDGLAEQWQVFIAGLEYGYDVPRTAIDFTPGRPLPEAGGSVRIAADRGWQNSGFRLAAGASYRVRAAGRYQVADQPRIWWCEPGGVSIRYYQGRPLGVLLAAVRREPPQPGEITALVQPDPVGLGTTLSPSHSGTLYLRINDSAAELFDNAGTLSVYIQAESERH